MLSRTTPTPNKTAVTNEILFLIMYTPVPQVHNSSSSTHLVVAACEYWTQHEHEATYSVHKTPQFLANFVWNSVNLTHKCFARTDSVLFALSVTANVEMTPSMSVFSQAEISEWKHTNNKHKDISTYQRESVFPPWVMPSRKYQRRHCLSPTAKLLWIRNNVDSKQTQGSSLQIRHVLLDVAIDISKNKTNS